MQPKRLTDFADGTQVQGSATAPDGQHLLVSLFRNHMQDLWLIDPVNHEWSRITETRADETDPFIGADGRAWFTSDVDGIFNVYAMTPMMGPNKRELLGGAYLANTSPKGHLFFTAFTGQWISHSRLSS